MQIRTALTFDDVLLVPQYSDISTRSLEIEKPEIDLSSNLGKGINLKIPIISANMKTVTGPRMARAMAEIGGMGLLHRFTNTIQDQISDFQEAIDGYSNYVNYIGCSLGISPKDKNEELAEKLAEVGCKIFCVDVAHGHTKLVGEFTEYLAKKYPQNLLIVGNVATKEGAIYLRERGADVVKAGIGGGSLCSTRIVTGAGVPQLTALDSVLQGCIVSNMAGSYRYSKHSKSYYSIISDGGIKNSGDLVKSLVFSDAVMLGNLLAGCDESPGEITENPQTGQKFKHYKGSSTHKKTHIEGVHGLVPYRGPLKQVIKHLLEGIASGFSYQGAHNVQELQQNAKFVQITGAGIKESYPHDIILS
jgi:IMP dehydrogenase